MTRNKRGFRYGRLLNVKGLLLNLKSIALREKEQSHGIRKEKLSSIQAQKQVHLKVAAPAGDDGNHELSTRDLQVKTWYTEQLNEDLRRQIHEVRLAENQVEEQREIVAESARGKKSLEKLKERQNLLARIELGRAEQKDLDELAGRKHSDRSGTGQS